MFNSLHKSECFYKDLEQVKTWSIVFFADFPFLQNDKSDRLLTNSVHDSFYVNCAI